MLMRKTLLLIVTAMLGISAWAQSETFVREMPCKNDLGEVIATKMGTICLPYAATPVDCSVYKLVSASADEWVFKQVLSMDANTPYVFVVDNNTTLEASFQKNGEEVACSAPTAEAAGVADAFVGSYQRKIIRGEKMYYFSYDKVCYNNGLPVMSTPNRGYFKSSVMPEGQTLSDNVKMTFLQANSSSLNKLDSDSAEDAVSISRQSVGLESGSYQINGKKVVVK